MLDHLLDRLGSEVDDLFVDLYVRDRETLKRMLIDALSNCEHELGLLVTVHYVDNFATGGETLEPADTSRLYCMDCERLAPIPRTWGITPGTSYLTPTMSAVTK